MLENIKGEIKKLLEKHFIEKHAVTLSVVIEEPKQKEMGEIALPLFTLYRDLKVFYPKITDLFTEIQSVLKENLFLLEAEFVNGFLNIRLNRVIFAKNILNQKKKANKENNDKTIVIDYSAPNIAKNFSIGHLRSTIIGHALKNLYRHLGYQVIGVNHIGDWGTQYGKLIVAYEKWGEKEKIEANPVVELQKIYVKFHDEAKKDPALEDLARKTFKRLEDREPEMLRLWEYFRNESLKEFERIYQLLGVSFDYVLGEAFYNDKTDKVIEELTNKGLLVEDQGAMIVKIPDLIPALIQKTDGTTLYLTRELATVFYRYENYHFNKLLYVVGNEQKNHFDQLKAVIKEMNYDFYDKIEHVNFGLILLDGKKMSTRNGRTILLQEVINEAFELAKVQIEEKNPKLPNKEKVALDIAIGAIIFNDLKNQRSSDFEFDLQSIVKFEGATGPYLQYTLVRIKAILQNNPEAGKIYEETEILYDLFNEDVYFEIIKQIAKYDETLLRCVIENAPHYLCKYLLNLAVAFNQLYSQVFMLHDDSKVLATNMTLLKRLEVILSESLTNLGIKVLERM